MNRKLDRARSSHQPKRYEEEEEEEGSSSEKEEERREKEEKRDEEPEVNSLENHFKAMHPITSCHLLHRIFHQNFKFAC